MISDLQIDMWKIIFRRFITAVLTLFLLTIFAFSLLYLAPGDPAERILQAKMNGELPSSTEAIDILRQEMGLNVPPYVLYLKWASGVLHGDLGYSYITRRSAAVILQESLQATGELVLVSIAIVIFIGLTFGILSAWKMDSKIDRLINFLAILGVSIPNYVIAIACILVFAVELHLLPVAGRDGIRSMLMPAVALTIGGAAMLVRITRYAVIDKMRDDYVIAARSKGLREEVIFIRHILRNALSPIVTYIGLQLGWLFSGAVIVETIFSWPGTGRLLVDSVLAGDIPLVQGSVLLIGAIFIIINTFVDLLCIYIDPRIKPEGVL